MTPRKSHHRPHRAPLFLAVSHNRCVSVMRHAACRQVGLGVIADNHNLRAYLWAPCRGDAANQFSRRRGKRMQRRPAVGSAWIRSCGTVPNSRAGVATGPRAINGAPTSAVRGMGGAEAGAVAAGTRGELVIGRIVRGASSCCVHINPQRRMAQSQSREHIDPTGNIRTLTFSSPCVRSGRERRPPISLPLAALLSAQQNSGYPVIESHHHRHSRPLLIALCRNTAAE